MLSDPPNALSGGTSTPLGGGLLGPEGTARPPGGMEHLAITMADFSAAVKRVQPSVRREGFATTPNVTWADVGALEEVCYQI